MCPIRAYAVNRSRRSSFFCVHDFSKQFFLDFYILNPNTRTRHSVNIILAILLAHANHICEAASNESKDPERFDLRYSKLQNFFFSNVLGHFLINIS